MLIKKVHKIDDRGFYLEDEILQIPETLEEAKLLNFPIVTERVQIANPDDAVEPKELTEAKERHTALMAIPGGDPVIVFAAQQLADTIADLEAKFELDKLSNAFKIVESFTIPPLQSNQIEIEMQGSFYRAKWNGKKWIEGASADEIQEITRPKSPNWSSLQDSLRGTALFAKAIGTSNANGFALLLTTLSATHNLQDLEFAIATVRSGLSSDFTEAELKSLNGILFNCGFSLVIE